LTASPPSGLRKTEAWKALEAHHAEIASRHLRDLFAADDGRATRFTVEGAGLYLDYSKNRVTDETLKLLVALAEERVLAERRDAMFSGEHITATEDRAVLHVALRMPRDRSRGIRRATCRTARSSVAVMCSPLNIASRRSASTRSSASATSSFSVSSVTRFFE
jgi:hypothetical protein